MSANALVLHVMVVYLLILFEATGGRATSVQTAKKAGITDAPVFDAKDILKRAALNTCGYINGDPNQPVTCAGSSTCTYNGGAWGCCDQLSCFIPQVCQSVGTSICGIVGKANCVYTAIQTCSPDAPQCVRLTRKTANNDAGIGQSSWTCAATAGTQLVLAVTTTGGSGQSVTQDGSHTSAFGTSSTTSDSSTPTSGSENNPSSGKPKLSGGAWAGIGVSIAAVVIFLLIFLVKYCNINRKSPGTEQRDSSYGRARTIASLDWSNGERGPHTVILDDR